MPAISRAAELSPARDGVSYDAVARVPYFRDSQYRDLDIPLTLDFMTRRYVAPLGRRVDLASATMADCAAGFGWLSFAFLMAGGRRAVLIDVDEPRLGAAKEIARILRVDDRCEFMLTPLQDVRLGEDSVDIFASIETLEHVGKPNIRPAVAAMARCARQAVLLTTPNFLFPVVAHDTGLPLAHWLPAPVRHAYARRMGKAHADRGNVFLGPWHLAGLARKFRPISRYQTFETLAELDAFYPHYLPYGTDNRHRHRAAPKAGLRRLHVALATVLGPWSFALAPSLASIWLRR
jgi:2-polyprenyl-3-methyl-5-hydroxy-6-metoxy-1,4-benzoquinol methylase